MTQLPLGDIRGVDISTVLAGPNCARDLGDRPGDADSGRREGEVFHLSLGVGGVVVRHRKFPHLRIRLLWSAHRVS